MIATVIRVLDDVDKARAIRSAIQNRDSATFRIDLRALRLIPRSPFAYWLSDDLRALLASRLTFGSLGGVGRQGLATGDNFRHVRVWWETSEGEPLWKPFANGGRLSPFYSDIEQTVGYDDAHQEGIRQTGRYGRGASFYGQPGLTWAVRSSRFAPSALPEGCIFSTRGLCAFVSDPMMWLAVLNSKPLDVMFKVHLGRFEFPEFLAGVVPMLPAPTISDEHATQLRVLARRGWAASRQLDTGNETSHAFLLPAVLQVVGDSLAGQLAAWDRHAAEVYSCVSLVQSEIDDLCFELYGISEEDRLVITKGFGVSDDGDDATGDGGDSDVSALTSNPVGLAARLVSWAVGVGVGRFDVRLAAGEREWPVEPDPFDPLPVCSPGMLTGDDGLPLDTPPSGYPLEVSAVLVDDPGHRLDLSARVRAVFDVVFEQNADQWWADVGALLDPKTGEVGNWLRNGFFAHHLKTYSKSRRQAPILWPIGTRSGSYQVWLYAHRTNSDSLFRVLNDVVNPKITVEERRLTELGQDAGPTPAASQRKVIDAQATFVGELREFRDRLEAVAPLWAPDLNDGIVIVLAPLWELFAHHKPWSRELKSRWSKLASGDYDWAQLAMHLWPERIILKCASDRSLAIAHDLEDTFWVQDDDNADKWRPRRVPTTPIDVLIAERTNPTIIAAVQQATT